MKSTEKAQHTDGIDRYTDSNTTAHKFPVSTALIISYSDKLNVQ